MFLFNSCTFSEIYNSIIAVEICVRFHAVCRGKAVLHGIYNINIDVGYLNAGIDHNTLKFAV